MREHNVQKARTMEKKLEKLRSCSSRAHRAEQQLAANCYGLIIITIMMIMMMEKYEVGEKREIVWNTRICLITQ